MKQNPTYILKYISDIAYLLPVGQAIADMKPGVSLNSTGVLIWNLLAQDMSPDELVDKCAAYYEITPGSPEYPDFKNDISGFAASMISGGFLIGSDKKITDIYTAADKGSKAINMDSSDPSGLKYVPEEPFYSRLCIAGISVELYGEADFFSEKFDTFSTLSKAQTASRPDRERADITIKVCSEAPSTLHRIPAARGPLQGRCMCSACRGSLPIIDRKKVLSLKTDMIENAVPLINHPDLTVFEETLSCSGDISDVTTTRYSLYFHTAPEILKMEMNGNASEVVVYFNGEKNDETRDRLFHAIRMPFLFNALTKGYLVLHSASLLYKDRAWLFSGPSGTGKSTHTGLWKKLYDISLINGDLNLIIPDYPVGNDLPAGQASDLSDLAHFPCIAGIPWCGTSGIFDNAVHRLGGIVFLKQAPINRCEELSADKKRLSMLNRIISPLWKEFLLDSALESIDNIADKIQICRLFCTAEPEAAETMKNWIDAREI